MWRGSETGIPSFFWLGIVRLGTWFSLAAVGHWDVLDGFHVYSLSYRSTPQDYNSFRSKQTWL